MAFVAAVTGVGTDGHYSCQEVEFSYAKARRILKPFPNNVFAVELSGREDVPVGTLVLVHRLQNGTLVFQAP